MKKLYSKGASSEVQDDKFHFPKQKKRSTKIEKLLLQEDINATLAWSRASHQDKDAPKKRVRFSEFVIVYGKDDNITQEVTKQKPTMMKLMPPLKAGSRSAPKIFVKTKDCSKATQNADEHSESGPKQHQRQH